MSAIATGKGACGPGGAQAVAPALGAADWLSLSATPGFALLAIVTAAPVGTPDVLCATAHASSPLGGMLPMYAMMSVLHAAPWVRLVARQTRRGPDRAGVETGLPAR